MTATLVVAVAFAAGLVVGAAGDRIYLTRSHQLHSSRASRLGTRHAAERLDNDLGLTPQQHQQVQAILDRRHQRIESITVSVRPQIRQEIDAANREIAAILTPDQRKKFETLRSTLRRGGSRGKHDDPAQSTTP